jgi:hypothetical protein
MRHPYLRRKNNSQKYLCLTFFSELGLVSPPEPAVPQERF